MSILIADDSPTVRLKVSKALSKLSLDVIVTKDGKEARDAILEKSEEISVIILDEEMPFIRGSELCRLIRQTKSTQHIPVISLTSLSEEKDIIHIFQSGASDYVRKPFIEEELIARVTNLLIRHTVMQELESKIKERTLSLQNALTEAQAASKAKSTFVANMSHEMRTPLNGIIGFTNLLFQKITDPTDAEHLGLIKTSADSLLELINNILDFSKIEAGKIELQNECFDFRNLIQSIHRIFELQAESKNITLLLHIDESVPERVQGDPFRLQQVLINLLGNALKFTPVEGGAVLFVEVIEKKSNASQIRFTISDSGIGINKEQLKSIFQPFNQADISTTRQYGGTGLGLSITDQLVKLMGGDIEVASRAATGSRFRFALWFEHASKIDKIEQNNSNQKFTSNKKFYKVLVAEDNIVNQKLIQAILKKQGHEVLVVSNGQHAIEEHQGNTFDLILMDCQMPVLDGYESTRTIRSLSDKTKSSVPIIAVSANAMKGDLEKCLDAGMDGLIPKPINTEILWSTIESVISSFRK